MKKLYFSLIILLFLSVFFTPAVNAEELSPVNTDITATQNNNELSILSDEMYVNNKIKKELYDSITTVYGKEKTNEIYNEVLKHAKSAIEARSPQLKEQDITRNSEWYKNEIIYMFYADSFGVKNANSQNTFKETAAMLDYLKDLGVTTLYILPFADSPMKDAGFDVKNPRNVRKDLGGLNEFKNFVSAAKEKGFKIKGDLVLNHLSDEHEWFKKLEAGDETYLNYFITLKEMPEYKKYNDEKLGTVIEYTEPDGRISKRRLIFPENTDNHYRKITVNGNDYYIYHTFYPFQLDINWENPEVLYYMLDTVSNWANLGIDIFRMDAIPYLSKEAGTNAENRPKTHAIVTLLSNYIQLTAPSSVIQVEACQQPKDIVQYFGKDREVSVEINNTEKKLKRTSEAQIAYHFPYMNAIWATLVSGNKKYFTELANNPVAIPQSAAWGNFLRVHDELSLEMASPEVRNLIFEDLAPKGANFRNGFGVSGRLANFLDKNPNRILQAYSILFSVPGIPIIYYGDEVGVANNFENAKKSAEKRKKKQKELNLTSVFDSRDINRGEVPQKLFYGSTKGYYEFNSKVYKKVKHLIEVRKSLPVMVDGDFQILQTKSPHNLCYIRKNKEQQILVVNNLSKDKIIAEITLPANVILKNNGHITNLKNLINDDDVKVNVSLKNRTMHLRISPYQVLWLDLKETENE